MLKMVQKWSFSKNRPKKFFSRSRLPPLAHHAGLIFCLRTRHVTVRRTAKYLLDIPNGYGDILSQTCHLPPKFENLHTCNFAAQLNIGYYR